jgi:hypothetical protein
MRGSAVYLEVALNRYTAERGTEMEQLAKEGFREHIQRKGNRHRHLTPREQEGNRTRAAIRLRIEHAFGVQAHRAGNLLLRTVGMVRACVKIGLRNLAYNIDRMAMLLAANNR